MAAFLDQTIGDYKLVEHIGSGGMGEVYRAVHLRIGRVVAVKIMKSADAADSASERFRNEARVHSSLSHPKIATLYEFYEKDGHAYIVMEYVDGQTLSDCIQKEGRLGVDVALRIFKQVLEAVDYIHQCEIIHRDIKSNNIKLTSKHDIKLLDFGIAKAPFSSKLTYCGSFIGTMEYLAPEQILGKAATVQSDIWALGILLYEMIMGKPPFQSDSLPDLCDKITKGGYPPPSVIAPELPSAVENIIHRCLEKKASHRYTTANQLLKEVEKLPAEESGEAPGPTAKVRFSGTFSRLREYWTVVALLLVIAGGMVILKLLPQPNEKPLQGGAADSRAAGHLSDSTIKASTLRSKVRIDIQQGEPAEIIIMGEKGTIGSAMTPCEFEAPVGSRIDFKLRRSGYQVMKRSIIVQETTSSNIYTYLMCREGDGFCADE